MFYPRINIFEEAAGTEGAGGQTGGATTTTTTAETAPSTFDFRTLSDEKGQFVEGWQEKLPEEYAPHRATLANFKDFNGVTKALADNMAAARAKTEGMVKVPTAESKPEEVAAYRTALGIPEKPEDYGLKAPEKLPDGVVWDEQFSGGFAKKAHEIGLTKAQVEALSSWHLDTVSAQAQGQQVQGEEAYKEQEAILKQTFGSNYEKRTLDAKRAALTLGLPEDHPVFYRADTVLAMAKLSDLISEDKLISAQQIQNKLSPGTVAQDIMTNKDHPDYGAYHDPSHGRHKEVVTYVNEQMKRAYPG